MVDRGSRRRSLSDPSVPYKGKGRAESSSTGDRRRSSLKSKLTADQTKEDRVRKFFRHGVLRHDQRVFQNRGLCLDTISSGKNNLGIMLHITDKYNSDLDVDKDQTLPDPPTSSAPLKDGMRNVFLKTIKGEAGARESLSSLETFREAETLIKSQFAEKNVAADLGGVLDDDFTVDIAHDSRTSAILGAVEYVIMKRYLWVDAIAVDREARGLGVGQVLLNRVKDVARQRGKHVLCFALHDVVEWYLRMGFGFCEEFPRMPWHIGRFMVLDPSGQP
ncbi:hypothetical protein BC829DRAFT_260497 [Chytridium lagenaria]|nr:hypothetical protein BC829DRAFT_260497 [Chytridium lagenaria]